MKKFRKQVWILIAVCLSILGFFTFEKFTMSTSPEVSSRLDIELPPSDNISFNRVPVAIAWSNDGSRIATYSDYGYQLIIWTADGKILGQFRRPAFSGPLLSGSLAFIKDDGKEVLLTTAYHYKDEDEHLAFSLIDPDTGEVVRNISGPNPDKNWRDNFANIFAVSPDQSMVAMETPGGSTIVYVYKLSNFELIQKIDMKGLYEKYNAPTSFAFSPDSETLAVGTITGRILLLKSHSGDIIDTITTSSTNQNLGILSLSYDNSGKYLAVGFYSNNDQKKLVSIWDVSKKKEIASYPRKNTEGFGSLGWYPNNHLIIFGVDEDRTHESLRLWDINNSKNVSNSLSMKKAIMGTAYSPNGQRFAVGNGNYLTILDLKGNGS